MTSKSRKWTVDLCSEQRLYMIHSVYPTCISLNMKDQTVRHTRWPEPNRKEEHGSDFEVLRQEMFSGSSVNGSDPADELRILQQEFFLCDSSGAAVLTVFILKHRIALKNTIIYPEFTANMNRTGEALDVWLDVWVWSQVRFCLLIASWTGSEHICDIQEQKRFLSLVYTDELCWATVCGDVLFINEQQIQTWRLVVSFSPINTSIIRDNEPDEDFRLQTRQIKVDWGVWVRNTWRHIRTRLFKLKLQIFSIN